MSQYTQEVMQAILFRAFGMPLNETQQALLEACADTSPYHKEMIEHFADPDWLHEQLEIVREFPKDRVWQSLMHKIRESDDEGTAD